jgi:hypothetical protein
MAVYDTMQFVPNDVATVVMGLAASMGQFLLCAGAPGKRYALPHARVLMHQPSGGIGGTASDIAIQAENMRHTKAVTAERIAFHTARTVEEILRDSDRDRWFTAQEAKDYGFVDHVVSGADGMPGALSGPRTGCSEASRPDPERAPAPASSEVDPHHRASFRGAVDLGEPGVGEGPHRADVELLLDGVGGGHRVALERSGAALAGVGDSGQGQRAADTPPAVPGSGEEAGHGPDAVVGTVLVAAHPDSPAAVADQTLVGRAWLDGAPSHRLGAEVGDQPAGRGRPGVTAAGLLPHPVRALLDGEVAERLPRAQLEPLAPAP